MTLKLGANWYIARTRNAITTIAFAIPRATTTRNNMIKHRKDVHTYTQPYYVMITQRETLEHIVNVSL